MRRKNTSLHDIISNPYPVLLEVEREREREREKRKDNQITLRKDTPNCNEGIQSQQADIDTCAVSAHTHTYKYKYKYKHKKGEACSGTKSSETAVLSTILQDLCVLEWAYVGKCISRHVAAQHPNTSESQDTQCRIHRIQK